MKHFLYLMMFVIVSLLFFSCSAEKDLSKHVFSYGYDFTKYSKVGFLFTPEKYTEKYESVGLLVVEIYPEIYLRDKKNQYGIDEPGSGTLWTYNPVKTEEVLDSLFNISKTMGANSVINLEIVSVSEFRSGFNKPVPGIKASGFAIKRSQE